jgi:predicted outer membrane repeat protein
MIFAGGTMTAAAVATASASTVIVTSTAELNDPVQCNGAAPCSLRAALAVADAHPDDFTEILLVDGIYTLKGPLVLRQGAASLRPANGSVEKVQIFAEFNSRAIDLAPADGYQPYLEASGLHFEGGFDESGGIVHVGLNSYFIANSCSFWRGEVAGRGGGAIAVERGGYLSLTNAFFTDNLARYHNDCSSATGNMGGAIAAFPGSSAYITKSLFMNNTACRGGAIAVQNANVTLDSNTIYDNEAIVRGGALFLDGSATSTGIAPNVEMRFNTVHLNKVQGRSTLWELSYGGALALASYNGRLLLSGNAFTGNTLALKDSRLTKAIGTPGIECLMENSSPQIDSFGNFFGTVGQQLSNLSADAKIGPASNVPRKVSDCFPLATSSIRGIDSKILSVAFAGVSSRGSTSAFTLSVLFPSNPFNFLNNNFRPSPAVSATHYCPSYDTRGFRRPSVEGGICEIGAVEMDGYRP